jgi:hypothetical protein
MGDIRGRFTASLKPLKCLVPFSLGVVGEETLTQPGILGARVIRWKDVTEVRQVGYYCHVVSGKKKIVLSPYAYRNPESIVTMVLSRVADRDNLH